MSRFSVPDMSCGHCRASIEAALQPLGAQIGFDMEHREIEVEGLAAEKVLAALEAIGFPADVK